jgi:type VI secretion system secreted protein VgrG
MQKAFAFGNYRAVVVDNKDKEQFGRVMVWIPDLMPEVDRDKGIWARPANNPLGGRNKEDSDENYYSGTSYIPRKGSWVFVFFESGNINRPYYFGALDLENTKVLPENQVGTNPEDKWTILKSSKGRAIVISDDEGSDGDQRVEITGKKRKIKTPPTGDTDSVYTIDENMTTILLDERDGKQKVLIRTYKGDFLHIDIDEQNLQAYFKNDIVIKCDNDLKITANGDIDIKSLAGDIKVQADSGDVDLKSSTDFKIQSGGSYSTKSQNDLFIQAGGALNGKAGGLISLDGSGVNEQTGSSSPGQDASDATEADPKGERDT